MIKYIVRRSKGKSWAVDELTYFGDHFIYSNRWYFDTEEKARKFCDIKGEMNYDKTKERNNQKEDHKD